MADRLLLVEDDPRIRGALVLGLTDQGYEVVEAGSGESALTLLKQAAFDVVLLDLMLPGMDGFAVCRTVRARGDLPIIMITARSGSDDVIRGLEAGADDYVTKPVVASELAARVRALLRRARPPEPAVLAAGDVRIHRDRGVATRRGQDVHLTLTELRLLTELATAGGQRGHPRAAAGAGLGLRLLRRHPPARRPRTAAAAQGRGRPERAAAGADRPRRRLPAGRAGRVRGLARIPVRNRVIAAFAFGSVAVSMVVAAVTWNLTTGYMMQQREHSVDRQAIVNARLVDGALVRDAPDLAALLTGLASSPEAAIFVRQPDGWISGGTATDNIGPEDMPPALLAAADRGDTARQRIRVGSTPVVAVAMTLPRTRVSYVEVFPLRDLDRAFRFISLMLLGGVLATALLGATIGWWASRRALRPLTDLTAAAARIAHGDLSTRLPIRDDKDLGPIAAAFNETAGDLEARVARDARFASDVSHELRSPVTTMAAAMEVLVRRRDEVPPAARHAIDLLDTDLRRFRRLVGDLLEISRVDQGAFRLSAEWLDLGELVGNVVARSSAVPVEACRAGPGAR